MYLRFWHWRIFPRQRIFVHFTRTTKTVRPVLISKFSNFYFFAKKSPGDFFTRKKNFRSTSHLHAIFSPRLKQGPLCFLVRFLYFFLRARAPCFVRVILRPEKKTLIFHSRLLSFTILFFPLISLNFSALAKFGQFRSLFGEAFFLGLFCSEFFFRERERAGGHSVSLELPLTPKAESEQKRRTRLRCFWLD